MLRTVSSLTLAYMRKTYKNRIFGTCLGFCFGMLLAACAGAPPADPGSLFQRLGGNEGLTAIVNETIDTVAADPRTNHSFQKVDVKRLKGKIVEQLCALTGGGCKYSGDTMKQSHAGLGITEAEFYITVQVLRDVLDKRVGDREKNELLKILAPMKRDVVTG